MKKITTTLVLLTAFLWIACDDDCQPLSCQFIPIPPGEVTCQVINTSWFHNPSTGSCEQMSYTGCQVQGFSTKVDCETYCLCD